MPAGFGSGILWALWAGTQHWTAHATMCNIFHSHWPLSALLSVNSRLSRPIRTPDTGARLITQRLPCTWATWDRPRFDPQHLLWSPEPARSDFSMQSQELPSSTAQKQNKTKQKKNPRYTKSWMQPSTLVLNFWKKKSWLSWLVCKPQMLIVGLSRR